MFKSITFKNEDCMINMGSHPTPGIPLQSEDSLDKNGLQFGFIALINQ
jgi:hypothetical protein